MYAPLPTSQPPTPLRPASFSENMENYRLHGPRNVIALIKYTVHTQWWKKKETCKHTHTVLLFSAERSEPPHLKPTRGNKSWVWMHKLPMDELPECCFVAALPILPSPSATTPL